MFLNILWVIPFSILSWEYMDTYETWDLALRSFIYKTNMISVSYVLECQGFSRYLNGLNLKPLNAVIFYDVSDWLITKQLQKETVLEVMSWKQYLPFVKHLLSHTILCFTITLNDVCPLFPEITLHLSYSIIARSIALPLNDFHRSCFLYGL